MRWALLTFLLLLCFSIAESDPSYTQKDSIPFGVTTRISEIDHNWDSCFAIVYYVDDILDTTELALTDTGTWTGQHDPLSNSGGYMVKYIAYLSDEPTSYIEHFSVLDTLEFQGSASGLTATQIWEHDISGYSTAGYAGTYLRNASCWGTGTEKETLFVFDQSDTTALDVVDVTAYTASGTNSGSGQTNVNGRVIFNLDPATYIFAIHKVGIADEDDTLAISADGTDSIFVENYDVGSPAGGKCRVYGWIYDLTETKDTTYTVTAENSTIPLRYFGALISPYSVSTHPDTSGYFKLDLYKTALLTPDTSTYIMRILDPDGNDILFTGDEAGIEFDVPNQTTWRFTW